MQNAAAIVYTSSSEFMHNNRVGALREVVFRPIIEWVNEALDSAGISDRCYVINEGESEVSKYTGESRIFIRKPESGHPAFSAKEWIESKPETDFLLVSAEAVFTDPEVLKSAYERHKNQNEKLTIIASGGREALMKELSTSAFWVKQDFLLELFEKNGTEDKEGSQFLIGAMKILSDEKLVAGTHVAGKKEINMRATDKTVAEMPA